MKKIFSIILFALFLTALIVIPRARGNAVSGFVAAYSTISPVIDGHLGTAEWQDATREKINLTGPSDLETWVYIKHNGTYIHFGFLVWMINDHTYDQFSIFFDEGNDSDHGSGTRDFALRANQDDLKLCGIGTVDITLDDGCYKPSSFFGYATEIDFNASCAHENDHSTAESEIENYEGLAWVDDHWEWEFAIPFVGNDAGTNDVSDLNCTQTDTVGVKFQYFMQPVANYYYPAGDQYEIWTYENLTFSPPPPPNIESCSIAGVTKDTYVLGETIYVNGSGFPNSSIFDLYILEDTEWVDNMSLPARIVDTATSVSSDSLGNISPTAVWNNPQTLGKFDIVVDVNGNGKYDTYTDALDNNDVVTTAGLQIVPELALTVVLVFFAIATLLAARFKPRRANTLQEIS